MSDSRDRSHSDNRELKDNDGGLLMLGAFAVVGVLALLFAGGYGIVALLLDNGEVTVTQSDLPIVADPADNSVTQMSDVVPRSAGGRSGKRRRRFKQVTCLVEPFTPIMVLIHEN